MLASPGTAALRKTRSESLSLTALEESENVQRHERRAQSLGETSGNGAAVVGCSSFSRCKKRRGSGTGAPFPRLLFGR
jgi:hypothetical protein